MSAVRRAPGAVWRRIPSGVLVRVPGPPAEALLLTGTTADTWDLLEAPSPPSALDAESVTALRAAGLLIDADQLQ